MRRLRLPLLLLFKLVVCVACVGQAPAPDAPSAVKEGEVQPKRVMGVLPNFRSVSPGEVVARPTVKEKFVTTSLENFDYSAFFYSELIAAGAFAGKSTPQFHQGAVGYGRYYWHTLADQSIENYWVEFIIPALHHEDSRYFAMGRSGGGVWKRVGYSLSRVVRTRSDDGRPMFNLAEVAGSAAAAGTSVFYYPSVDRTAGEAAKGWGLDVVYDAAAFLFHEFWPDVVRGVGGHTTR